MPTLLLEENYLSSKQLCRGKFKKYFLTNRYIGESSDINIYIFFFRLGKRRVDALLTQATDSINYLEIMPTTTEEYVKYIKFVDQAQANVDDMESQLDYVKELYDTMEEFGFPIPSMDMANYLVTLLLLIINIIAKDSRQTLYLLTKTCRFLSFDVVR